MDDRFSDALIRSYLDGVQSKGALDSELARVQDLLVHYTKQPDRNKAIQHCCIGRTNQLFRALLELKAQLAHDPR
jgi:hypothetical protein